MKLECIIKAPACVVEDILVSEVIGHQFHLIGFDHIKLRIQAKGIKQEQDEEKSFHCSTVG